ncbi:methylmalonyl-CoA mutase family protein [Escherichia coli]
MPTDFFSTHCPQHPDHHPGRIGIFCRTVDPLAGSSPIESLTDQIVKQARTIIQQIDEAGGMAKAIEAGLPKRMIEEASARERVADRPGQACHRWCQQVQTGSRRRNRCT